MATVILARHGRTTANATGVLAGRSKGVHLDEHGLEQTRKTAGRLAGLPLAAAFSSPLERCRETARELLRQQPEREGGPLKAVSERGLVECDYGAWTGLELTALAKEPMWKTVQSHPSAAAFPDGESMADMSARAVAAVRRRDAEVEAEHGADAVWLAVSHGDVIKAILADALGNHLDTFQRIVVDPASLSVVRYTPMRPFVVSMNTASGDLASLKPSARKSRRRKLSSDADVGGGAGTTSGTTSASAPGSAPSSAAGTTSASTSGGRRSAARRTA